MEYELVMIVEAEGREQCGYAIKKVGANRLTSVHILPYEEARIQLGDLNERALLAKFWPIPYDDEVQALIADPNFHPVEYEEIDVPDVLRSEIVFDMKPGARIGMDASGNPIFGPDEVKYDDRGEPIIDWAASKIVYKKERQPKRTQSMSRIEAASKQVALRRLAQSQADCV